MPVWADFSPTLRLRAYQKTAADTAQGCQVGYFSDNLSKSGYIFFNFVSFKDVHKNKVMAHFFKVIRNCAYVWTWAS